MVCLRCRVHTREMLGLQQDPLAAPNTPFNHDRLVQTPLVGAPGAPAALQDGVSPVDPPNPAGPTGPFIPGGLGLAASANWWHRTLAERLGTVTVGLAGRTEPPFDGFLTRLCTNCEDLVLHEEFFDRIGRIARNAPQSVRKWWEDPFLCTCTCRRKLGAAAYSGEHVLCKEHREQQWKELVQVKNRRDRWLRNVQINLVNGRLQQATVATKRDRVNASGWWRACRVSAGREIFSLISADIW